MKDKFTPYNLIHARWIPVRRQSGKREKVQPSQITEGIEDDPIVAFDWPRPDFNGSTHEFLIGLLATACAPENEDEWNELWNKPPSPELLANHFSRVVHAFNLDGLESRFFQDDEQFEEESEIRNNKKPIATLLIDTPGAQTIRNNADLFVKRTNATVFCRATAAMALYTLNTYAPSGGQGHRTSLRGGGPLTTLIVDAHPRHKWSLWGRLWPNVNCLFQKPDRFDHTIFPWLGATKTSENGIKTTPEDVHPLQMYWGMPRRIRMIFSSANGRVCSLTGIQDDVVVENYVSKKFGFNYSEGFEHSLSPYYKQKDIDVNWLPVHPQPGGICYRNWPGLVVSTSDGLRRPASVIRHWFQQRKREFDQNSGSRIVAQGYDMDNMKARAWIESEMPIWNLNSSTWEQLQEFIEHVIAGAEAGGRWLKTYVKSAMFARPADAPGDYSFVSDRFFRDTEEPYFKVLNDANTAIKFNSIDDDPTLAVRQEWSRILKDTAIRLFDEYAPIDGIEYRDIRRYVKAKYDLNLTMSGLGKNGKKLYSSKFLDIAVPQDSKISRE